ncbi:hypothetical protein DAERI_150008 [Deinococcus aerius]|uniref:Uncharacterized protein n=1 Tax=Deinococcus aerius TaxID=200253 RepID=A0A2I9DA46_9DEIO|nr:hypothetical protein DAERI_150008 [Deinococcus aerius]
MLLPTFGLPTMATKPLCVCTSFVSGVGEDWSVMGRLSHGEDKATVRAGRNGGGLAGGSRVRPAFFPGSMLGRGQPANMGRLAARIVAAGLLAMKNPPLVTLYFRRPPGTLGQPPPYSGA